MTSRPRGGGPRGNRRSRQNHAASLESIYFGQGSGSASTSTDARSDDDRRARQLCRQVREQLELALAELDDPLLDGVAILDVVSAGAHVLRVELSVDGDTPVDRVHARLAAIRGRLRAEAAAAITRKRAPMLELVVVPTSAWPEEPEETHDER